MLTEFDWALAIEKYDSTAEYRLDDSANPTGILFWKGNLPQPTFEQLAEAAAQIKPPPNWRQFGLMMAADPMYLRVANSMSEANPSLLVVMKISLNNTEDINGFRNVAAMWNTLIPAALPTEAEITRIQQIADTNNVPISFAADGTISVAE